MVEHIPGAWADIALIGGERWKRAGRVRLTYAPYDWRLNGMGKE